MGVVYYLMFESRGKKFRHKGPYTKPDAEAALASSLKSHAEFCKRIGRASDFGDWVEAVEVSDELASIVDRAAARMDKDNYPATCVGCGSPHIGHNGSDWRGKASWCCRCHVLANGTPADWHPACVATYREMAEKANALAPGHA